MATNRIYRAVMRCGYLDLIKAGSSGLNPDVGKIYLKSVYSLELNAKTIF